MIATRLTSRTLRGLAPCVRQLYGARFYSTEKVVNITSEKLETSGEVAVVTMNRPKAKNAISFQFLRELRSFVEDLSAELSKTGGTPSPIRALIITSSLKDVFCAGADLKERKTFTPAETADFLIKLNSTLDMIENLPIPTISAIDGLALGGGLELALSTDFRVLSKSALVGLPETRLAIVPGAGGTHRLPKLIGYSRALDVVLTGRRVPADEALMLGIANRVVEGDALDGAREMAQKICEGGPLAISAGKKAIRGASHAWERVVYEKVVNSKDKFEALDAFAEKRKPRFTGE